MERKILAEIPDYPQSKVYEPTKALLSKLDAKLPEQKEISKQKNEKYIRIIKELNWSMGKVQPQWPIQVERNIDNLKSILQEIDGLVRKIGEGSSFFCGSKVSPKEVDSAFTRLAGYEKVFTIIDAYQDKKLKEEIVSKALNLYDKESQKMGQSKANSIPKSQQKAYVTETAEFCKNCELMQAVSICPNGYIAKKLLKELPNTEWIAGILHEEGTIVDKDIERAIDYYQKARNKKNYQALYRLGSLNERGLYGRPYEYLKMWEEAGTNGHLEALTDMGYLYENGLEDDDTGRVILEPNQEKAFTYYKKASQNNFPRALNNLATFYFSNEKYRSQQKCLQYLERASEAEYVKSLHNLGLIYYEGKIVKQNEPKALKLIKRAAQKGDIEGRIMYVEMMLNESHNCSGDTLAELNRYCRQIIAKDEENCDAYYFLGVMYEEGFGVSKSLKTAFLYYSVAASMKSEAALFKLGECYRNGFGVEQDLKQAVKMFEQAQVTNKTALISLGEIYEKGGLDFNPNYERAFQFFYQACNHNIPEAYTHVGSMYKFGRYVAKNEHKAQEYFEKAKNIERKGVTRLNSSSSDLIQSSYYRRR